MKKSNYGMVLIGAVQIIFLIGMLLHLRSELAEAPIMTVTLTDDVSNYYACTDSLYRSLICPNATIRTEHEDPKEIGKSIWWDASKMTETFLRYEYGESRLENNNVEIAVVGRPQPDASVRGAQRVGLTADYPVSVIWTPQKIGEWTWRVEAPGSSEDVLRDGEVRTKGMLSCCSKRVTDEGKSKVTFDFEVQPFGRSYFYPQLSYKLTDTDFEIMKTWVNRHKEDNPAFKVTARVAVREGKSPVIIEVFVNGLPLREALQLMKEDKL